MKKLLIALLLAVPMVFLAEAQTSQPKVFQNQESLKILSWNIKMLPHVVVPSGKFRRSRLIGEVLDTLDYDIIVFQEAFHRASRNIIFRKLKDKYPYRYGPANLKWFSIKTNSGIWIVSKVPLEVLGEIDYCMCRKDDCWARKGALMVAGDWNGKKFQIIGTHLEAGGPQEIKDMQYTEIRDGLIVPFAKPDIPLFICGDMNTNKESESYTYMLEVFGATDGELSGEVQCTTDGVNNDMKKRGDNQNIIDFIFLRDINGNIKEISRYVSVLEYPWSKKHRDLSDHYGVAAEIWFK